ncbi:anaphase-promoting complex subunit 4-like [Ylistrum balloti]|uniref:anaphase-promoting complex subunit 4-like n=1 Tax=Ylistrum balloti TaxID=509963 RepID=UPI002905EF00|nr:anaphase-promoting complex subunit 4-like [Ylistrum balloti]
MPEETVFKQVDEKHVSVEVELMLWSPKFDLVALSNVQGEVVLHRLSWQKVWLVAPPVEDVRVTALAWRPDGKVLAAGYTCGKINLYDIENSEILTTLELPGEVTCMSWITQSLPEGSAWSPDPYDDDNAAVYLPKLQPLNKSYGTLTKGTSVEENVEDRKKLNDQKELNLLLAGCGAKELHMFAYGVYPIGDKVITPVQDAQLKQIHSAEISQDLHMVSMVIELAKGDTQEQEFSIMTFDTRLLSSRYQELRILALKCGQIATLMGYLQQTIQQMSEAWEDILMEMDSKLLKFAGEKRKTGTSTVSNDFLELLMFGTPSPELQAFLLHELTEKGLKNLGHSIETSYSNIQKLVVQHLQVVSQAILYHLSDLRGMSAWYEKFGVLGMHTQKIQEAVTAVGSFVLKTSEIQQVIDNSIKNFKAFFRWLYVVILRLSNEKPPAELSKMTQHDINFVAEFLRDNFAHFTLDNQDEDDISIADLMEDHNSKSGFKLEKVGQYLKREDLHYPPSVSSNPWIQFQKGCFHLKDTDILYPVQNTKSLVQLLDILLEAIHSALSRPSMVIGSSFECLSSRRLFTIPKQNGDCDLKPKICQFTSNECQCLYTVYTMERLPSEDLIILRQSTTGGSVHCEAVAVKFGEIPQRSVNTSGQEDQERFCKHRLQDVGFYDERTLSLLLVEEGDDETPVLVQLPLAVIADSMYTSVPPDGSIQGVSLNVIDIGEKLENCQRLDNMKAHSFSVSGTRKTAIVLFSSKRRVRIFLMDAEEEEEDEDEADETGDLTEADISGAQVGEGDISDMSGIPEGNSVMQVEEGDSEGQEDKENLNFLSPS